MTDDRASARYRRLGEAFERCRRPSGEARAQALAELAAEDAALADEVRRLLDQDAGEDVLSDAAIDGRGADGSPERIGRYRIVGRLGEGGMGVVYEAIQDAPERRVAIKLLHPSQATPERLRRLRLEADVLGRLHHPGIAQILEAGTFDSGRGPQPFFAMERVEGVDLRASCARGHVDLRGRVELVARIAEAVEHAHQKGVVHRDLKPDNVLVDPYGQPKVLDFGIARAMEGTDLVTQRTRDGEILGTLAYMAPEQVRGDAEAIGPRTDVYGLGVLLYELVAGQLPFAVDGLGLATAVRVLQEDDPVPLGTLDRALRGDLEWIVERALRKEARDRYPSAAALAADLRRWLRHEPVQARPPSRAYRLRKLVRKNRGLFTAVAVVLLSLAVGLGWALVEQRRADHALQRILRLSDVKRVGEVAAEADALWPAVPERIAAMEDWLERARALAARRPGHEAQRAALEQHARADAAEQWQLQVLTELTDALRALAAPDGTIASVERRLAFARTVHERTLDGPEARAEWAAACASIADREACPRYDGLVLAPQLGLRPLGRDPGTGLHEFWHVQSGARPELDPRWPADGAPGRWIVTAATGLVLVLLPGGTFRMGSDEDDVLASASERPANEVTLAPFFLSRHEMTQAQWQRFTGTNPSYYAPGGGRSRTPVTLVHPVEQVSWLDVDRVTADLGLALPTEAQWEYACRAGSATRWHTGDAVASLAGFANVADAGSIGSFSADWAHEADLVDGFDVHAPVGSFRPNAFGLHDMHGNVWEWCRDAYADYTVPARPGDGLRAGDPTLRVYRGGSSYFVAARARSASRNRHAPGIRFDVLGVRPARAIER